MGKLWKFTESDLLQCDDADGIELTEEQIERKTRYLEEISEVHSGELRDTQGRTLHRVSLHPSL